MTQPIPRPFRFIACRLLALSGLLLAGTAAAAPAGLTAGQLHDILVAEFARQANAPALAHRHYLRAARATGSAALAELAVGAAMSAGDVAGTGEALDQWLAVAPASTLAHQVAAQSRMRAGDPTGALTHLVRLLALAGPDVGAGYDQVAAVLARIPDRAARLALMQALAERSPDQPEAWQTLALVAAAAERAGVAEDAARRALALRPDWTPPRLLLVRLRLLADRRDEARRLLGEFVARQPEEPALRLLQAQLLVEAREFAPARAEFEQVLRLRPGAPEVLLALGVLSLELNDPDSARRHLLALYESGERRDEAAFQLGQTEERAGQDDAALTWYGRVGGASTPDARLRMALLHARTGALGEARELLQRLRDQSPGQAARLYLVEAELLEEAGATSEARALYDQAVAAHPDDLDLRYARALQAARQDRVAEAEQDLRRVIAADPTHVDALNALGYTLADRTDRHAEALALIERAAALKPDEPAILDSLGWVHFRLGHHERALDYLRRALAALDDGEIAAHLGEVLWAMGRQDEARAVWEKALRAHADDPYLRRTTARHAVGPANP